jgi:hypothetical protein
MSRMAYEIGWHSDQVGGLRHLNIDELNRHLRRTLHTKERLFQIAADELADRETAPMLASVYSRWSELLEEAGETEKALQVGRRALRARENEFRT